MFDRSLCSFIDSMNINVAVPDLSQYTFQSGIGRVFCSLAEHWQRHGVTLIDARLRAYPFPLLRNIPYAVDVPVGTDLVLLPKMTGATALGRTQGCPSLAIVHDIGIVDCPADRITTDPVSNWSIRRSLHGLRHASHIVCDSVFTQQALLRFLPQLSAQTSVILPGVTAVFIGYSGSIDDTRERLEHDLASSLPRPLLIYVGSELPRKNIAVLLKALTILKADYPGAALLKVGRAGGDYWRQQTLGTMASLGLKLNRDVLILEDIDDARLADAYAAADVFVTTSLYEGFGLPALEALAVGTPVVVSDRGSLPEIVGDVGTVVKPTPERVAAALAGVLAAPPSVEKVLAFRRHAAGYSWARAATHYLSLMDTLI